MNGEQFSVSGDTSRAVLEKPAESSPDQLSSSGEITKMSVGSGEQLLLGGNKRGADFTHWGRQRGRLSGLLIQGV